MQRLRILIVEDNEADFHFLAHMLTGLSMQLGPDDPRASHVHWAPSLQEGLRLMEQEDYDSILLDYRMPGVQDFEAVEEIVKKVPYTPVVVLTGMEDGTLADAVISRGAQDYILKGRMNRQNIFTAILHAIARKRGSTVGVPVAEGQLGNVVDLEVLRSARTSAAALKKASEQ